MAPSAADHAYDHALAVTRAPDTAARATAGALTRPGRNLGWVLAYTSRRALAEIAAEGDPELPTGVPADLVELAWALAATRPAPERAVLDLDTRHGLNRAGMGRALGLPPARAASRAAEVDARWEHDLGPALLAWLGPGECPGLHELLAARGLGPPPNDGSDEADEPAAPLSWPATSAGDVLAAAPAVATHIAGCDLCTDRRRSVPTVRSLLARVPVVTAPAEVVTAARTGRRVPSLPRPPAPQRRHLVAAAVVLAAVAVAGIVLVTTHGRSGSPVAALTRVPSVNALAASPASVDAGEPFTLHNRSKRTVAWEASTSVPWASVVPASGKLDGGRSARLTVRLNRSAPEGELRVDVGITGDDGSATVVHLDDTVEHPPTVAATVDGCHVSASAEDEGQVSVVTLRWTATTGDGARIMSPDGDGYAADLPATADITSWWVDAVDARGNRASTVRRAAASCKS